jgi:isochorismate pyruvate lyase
MNDPYIDLRVQSRHEAEMADTSRPLTMADIRKEIDRIDESLIKLLAERQRWVEKAVIVKKRDGLPARDDARIAQVIDHVRVLARGHKVDPALVEAMWTEMVEWFVAYEERSI